MDYGIFIWRQHRKYLLLPRQNLKLKTLKFQIQNLFRNKSNKKPWHIYQGVGEINVDERPRALKDTPSDIGERRKRTRES